MNNRAFAINVKNTDGVIIDVVTVRAKTEKAAIEKVWTETGYNKKEYTLGIKKGNYIPIQP